MKVIEEGNGAQGWSIEKRCTGEGNGRGGCGAKLLVEARDLYETRTHDHGGGMDSFITFRCTRCDVQTDLDDKEARAARQAVPNIPYRTQQNLRGGNRTDPF